jgi:elongation factor Ts
MGKFFAERVLLEQAFVKDGDRTITDLLQATIQKTGENITIRQFARYRIGE